MNYNKTNNLMGWLCGIIATMVYILTADRSTSWWDTGEFIASADKLQIVHQPGAPLFLMIQNLFANLAGGDTSQIAFWMNVGSAVCSGMTIVFLFWTITALVRKTIGTTSQALTATQTLQIIGAGTVGAMAYAFTDTFWYSAVESEVYAMSSLCTAVVFWLVLKWERRADEPDANKWLLMIAYVMGLSIGVHLLNLLTIPAIALVVYFRKTDRVNWQGITKALGIGVAILALILWGIIQYTVRIAASFDLFFVNSLGLGFGSGIAFFVLLVIGGLVYGIVHSIKRHKPILNTAILGVCFVLLGYSSYTLLPIRAQTDIALNNNEPDDIFSFYGYLTREQYPSEPLFKGPAFDSRRIDVTENTFYRKDADRYTAIESGREYIYDNEMLFPRVWSDRHASFYQNYLGLGEHESPTQADNLKFFFSYQMNHMYWRYFMWNFAGRQSDTPNPLATYTDGNWISGIKSLDNARLGGQYDLSDSFLSNPSRNTYFFLPLLLGLAGILWHFRKDKKDAAIVSLLFFFTGIAIVLYLNQSPLQPRERDYAYAGSFYMFSIWIGLGSLALLDLLKKRINLNIATSTALALGLLAGPVILISENWNDHDRSGRMMARDIAHNYLESCAPNAILFTYSDNDTFPLWYLQEVENVRRDVRVVNLSYLQSDWYVQQMMRDLVDLEHLPIDIDPNKIAKGVRDGIMFVDMGIKEHTDIKTLLDIMLSDNQGNQVQLQSGQYVNILPTKNFRFAIDREAVLHNDIVPTAWADAIPSEITWAYNKDFVSRAELSLLSILVNNNWERPIYFTSTMPSENYMGLDKYMISEGLVVKMMPVEHAQPEDRSSLVNSGALYSHITEKFKWGNISQVSHFDVDSKFTYENFVLPDIFGVTLKGLMRNQELEKAREVANIAYDAVPRTVSSMTQVYHNGIIIDTLYKTREIDKANEFAQRNVDFLTDELHYKTAVYQQKGEPDMRSIQLGMASIDMYKEILADADNPGLLASVDALDRKYRQVYGQ